MNERNKEDLRWQRAYDEALVKDMVAKQPHRSLIDYACAFSMILNRETLSEESQIVYRALYDACICPFGADRENPYEDWIRNQEAESILGVVGFAIADPMLRSRVFDLIWTVCRDEMGRAGIDLVKEAVVAYENLQIDSDGWFFDGLCDSWNRGLRLARSVGKLADGHFANMKKKINDAYRNSVASHKDNDVLRWALPSLLMQSGFVDLIPGAFVAENLRILAREQFKRGEYQAADVSMTNAQYFFRVAKNECEEFKTLGERIDMALECAGVMEKSGVPQCANFYEHALHLCKQMPTKLRGVNDCDKKCSLASLGMRRGYELINRAMSIVRTPMQDITQVVRMAKEKVSGLSREDALKALVSIVRFSEAEIESDVKKTLSQSISSLLFSRVVVAHGRPVAAVPPFGGKDDAARLKYEKVCRLAFSIGCYYEMSLRPAFDQVLEDHDFDFDAVKAYVQSSGAVPENHALNYSEGLKLGFEGRFTAAASMLTPEIENIVRVRLDRAGAPTTSLGRDGFQQENGLSRLVEEPLLVSVFGVDMAFELQAFFCDHTGPNMRNEIAHGLKDDMLFNSAYDFYVWWFALRLIILHDNKKN